MPEAPAQAKPSYPPFDAPVQGARDLRGAVAPDLAVGQWVTAQPSLGEQVVIVDFWATWCENCRKSITHMNDLARQFRDDVVIIGLSSETRHAFNEGLKGHALSLDYALALDEKGAMARAISLRGIPHVLVMSSDRVVRWQGSPTDLDQKTLGLIVEANAMTSGPGRNRWTGG